MANLRNAEIRKLWQEFRQTEDEEHAQELRRELIEHYLPLVRRAAERLGRNLPGWVDVREMISAGFIGLIQAVDRFDPGRGVRFESYCASRVRGAMLDEFRRRDWVPGSALS